MQISVLGLSQVGKIVVEKLLADGHEVVVWDEARSVLEEIRVAKAEDVVSQKLIITHTIEEQQNILRKPSIFLSFLNPGEPTESILTRLSQFAGTGDIIIDGAVSHFFDTDRRFADFEKKGIKFLGVGIVGGVHALENGFSLMVGGNTEAYQYVTPLLDAVSKPNGIHTYFGVGGAGHFVQMVHNGIEHGMLQAIGEGMGILSKSGYQINLIDAINAYQEGGIASSFLLDMTIDALSRDPFLTESNGMIDLQADARWSTEQAKSTNVPTPATEQSIEFAEKSQYDKIVQDSFVAKIIQAMLKEVRG